MARDQVRSDPRRREMSLARFLHVVGLAALVTLTASPALGQEPRSGGWLNLRLREDLPPGFAIPESPTISTMWPALEWRLDYFAVWPHVKNLVPHHSIYGWGRLQEVWRDK